MLTKRDYIRMSNEEIRGILLILTPIGTKEAEVKNIIRGKIRRSIERKVVYDNPKAMEFIKNDPDPSARNIELGDFDLDVILARHGWAKHLFLMGYTVEASWLFSKDGLLKNIRVSHLEDGI